MKRKREKENKINEPENHDRPYSEMNNVVSATECTGLTQFVPEDEQQADSFRSVYDITLNNEKAHDEHTGERRVEALQKKK